MLGHFPSRLSSLHVSSFWSHLDILTPHIVLRVIWGKSACANAQRHLELHRWFGSNSTRHEFFRHNMEDVPCDPLPELLTELATHASIPSFLLHNLPTCIQRAIISWWLASRSLLAHLFHSNAQLNHGSFPISEHQLRSIHTNVVLLAAFLLSISQPLIICTCCARTYRNRITPQPPCLTNRRRDIHTPTTTLNPLISGDGVDNSSPPQDVTRRVGDSSQPQAALHHRLLRHLPCRWWASLLCAQQTVPGTIIYPSQSIQLAHAFAAICYGVHSTWSDNHLSGWILLLLMHWHCAIHHKCAAPHSRRVGLRPAGQILQLVPLDKGHPHPHAPYDVRGDQLLPPTQLHKFIPHHVHAPASAHISQGKLHSLRPRTRSAHHNLPRPTGLLHPLSKLQNLFTQAKEESKRRMRRHAVSRYAAKEILSNAGP